MTSPVERLPNFQMYAIDAMDVPPVMYDLRMGWKSIVSSSWSRGLTIAVPVAFDSGQMHRCLSYCGVTVSVSIDHSSLDTPNLVCEKFAPPPVNSRSVQQVPKVHLKILGMAFLKLVIFMRCQVHLKHRDVLGPGASRFIPPSSDNSRALPGWTCTICI
jgi:hypothetical protein